MANPTPAAMPELEVETVETPLTPEEELAATEAAIEREAARVKAINDVGEALEKLKDEAVSWRADYEAEWMRDYQQYNHATPLIAETKREGSTRPVTDKSDEAYRSTTDNITRPKVIITAARLGDMLFPTNDANFSIEASPNPDVPDELLPQPPPGEPDPETGEPTPPVPYTPEQLVAIKKDFADRAARNMDRTVQDQLEECQYAESGRAAIFDGCLYGTGVLFGPAMKPRRKHGWKGGIGAQMVEQAKPTAEWVDLWTFFPQPSRSMAECEHVFRLHLMNPSAIRRLIGRPGFDKQQIATLLGTAPVHGALANTALNRGYVRPDAEVTLKDKYSVWQFRGPMPKSAFAAFASGLAAQEMITMEDAIELTLELEKDTLTEIDCEVWVSQGIVIKMALSTMAAGNLGYQVFNYEKSPHSIFGHGVAYLCRDDQQATTQLWHAMMLNSMMSAGPQIGVRQGCIMPSGDSGGGGRMVSLSATKPRVWALNDEVKDIREALSVFIIPNVTGDLMRMYERSKANADEHTMTPMLAAGEGTSAVPTSSGMAMLMNAANVVMRRLAKAWDDNITIPLIGSFYDWNMSFNPDESIKGDYCVIPKGASHLLIKDVQAQHVQFATTLFSTNPALAAYMKPGVFARKNIEMLDIPADEMLYTDDEVADQQAKMGEQPNPDVIKAQAAATTAEAQAARAQTEQAIAQSRIEFDRWERDLQHQERMAELAVRENIQKMQLEGQNLSINVAMSKMDSAERIAFQRMMEENRRHQGNLNLEQYRVDTKVQTDVAKIASKEQQTEREIAVESPNPRIQ